MWAVWCNMYGTSKATRLVHMVCNVTIFAFVVCNRVDWIVQRWLFSCFVAITLHLNVQSVHMSQIELNWCRESNWWWWWSGDRWSCWEEQYSNKLGFEQWGWLNEFAWRWLGLVEVVGGVGFEWKFRKNDCDRVKRRWTLEAIVGMHENCDHVGSVMQHVWYIKGD